VYTNYYIGVRREAICRHFVILETATARMGPEEATPLPAPFSGRRSYKRRPTESGLRVAWWRNGRASDLRSRGREFDLRPGAAA